jgi:regulatory protein
MPDNIVELKPRPRGRITVKLAGGRFFTIPQEAVTFAVGTVLADEDIVRLDRMDQYFRGKDKALRLISKRMRTRDQVAASLEKLNLEQSICDGIVGELEEAGLINDLRFAREYVKVKRDVRNMGPFRLRHDLIRFGVRKAFVEQALEESFDAEIQERMARETAFRRVGSGPVDEKAARRIADHLRRKGFDFEIVNHVVHDLLHRPNAKHDHEEEIG